MYGHPQWLLPVVMLGCVPDCEYERDLVDGLLEHAGGDAIDCGNVEVDTDGSAVDACVVMAFTNGEAFYAQYELQGVDSDVVRGVAGDQSGRVRYLLWTSDGDGGVSVAERCDDPTVDSSLSRDAAEGAPLACSSTTALRTCTEP